jgi:hypothetical protein
MRPLYSPLFPFIPLDASPLFPSLDGTLRAIESSRKAAEPYANDNQEFKKENQHDWWSC